MSKIMSVALYMRVSTDEQSLDGLSLQTQEEDLIAYANEHGYKIYKKYVDDGYSAKNLKRPKLLELLEDIKLNKIDLVLFTKLDRWNRRVSDYYKLNEVLEAHRTHWVAIYEKYNTSTTDGIFHVNIMLSVAENEQRQISDRVKAVLKNKRLRGEHCNGNTSIGFKKCKDNKSLVVDEESEFIVRDLFDAYEKIQNANEVTNYICDKYDLQLSYRVIFKMLRNEMYKGWYDRKGILNKNYCDAIISESQFDRVQGLLKNNGKKSRSTNKFPRDYIFRGMVYCSECGHKFNPNKHKRHEVKKETYRTHYRCYGHSNKRVCDNSISVREQEIEDFVINEIKPTLEKQINELKGSLTFEKNEVKQDTKKEITKLQNKLSRLKDLYVNDLIDLDDYKKDYATYNERIEKLKSIKEETFDIEDYEKLLKTFDKSFWKYYKKMSEKEKWMLWNSVIKAIYIDKDRNKRIILK